jgi:hypothetical protein
MKKPSVVIAQVVTAVVTVIAIYAVLADVIRHHVGSVVAFSIGCAFMALSVQAVATVGGLFTAPAPAAGQDGTSEESAR